MLHMTLKMINYRIVFKWIDRELIHPVWFEEYYTQTMSLIDHLFILPVAYINISFMKINLSFSRALIILYTFFLAYTLWLYHIHSVTGKWVYPFINEMGVMHFTVFFVPVTALMSYIALRIGYSINSQVSQLKIKPA